MLLLLTAMGLGETTVCMHILCFPLLTNARAEMSGANDPDIAILIYIYMINENLKEEVLQNREKLAQLLTL